MPAPNPAARTQITGRTTNIGVVLPDLANPFFPSVVKAIQTHARRHDPVKQQISLERRTRSAARERTERPTASAVTVTPKGVGTAVNETLVLCVIALFAVNVVLTTIGVRFGTGN